MAVLEGVADLWRDVGLLLFVPGTTLDVITSDNALNTARLRAVIIHWIRWDPHASWRRLVWRFDDSVEGVLRRVAGRMRSYCEGLAGQCEKVTVLSDACIVHISTHI
jgi:hypothetical protein